MSSKIAKSLRILPVKPPPKRKGKRKRPELNPILPKPPFLVNLISPVKSGGSVFLMNMIFNPNFYKDWFDVIYYFSPSSLTDKSTYPLRTDDDQNIILIYNDLENIDEVLKAIQESQMEEQNRDRQVLIVMDDMLNFLSIKEFSGLCSRYRHKNISIFTKIQLLRKLPPACRANQDAVCIWRIKNNRELAKVEEEFLDHIDGFMGFYKKATKKKYDFLYYNVLENFVFKNFDVKLYDGEARKNKEG